MSNNRSDGILGKGELDFHDDPLFQEVPLRALILFAIEIPESGIETSLSIPHAPSTRCPTSCATV